MDIFFMGQDILVSINTIDILLLLRICYHHVIIKIIPKGAYNKCMTVWSVIFSTLRMSHKTQKG